ncbi:Crp/Fnr family transcriptional regulator [Aedoeadaptatus coxii]|uniref:Crp/Fnr family transcriptional regulator n=1 Tax=Aedoeadaptatus coxii TaxID=755172 RepID=UPI002AD4D1D7|nr:Crp/Fnr family transcriptional regulator [Peptoniphilus coxii]
MDFLSQRLNVFNGVDRKLVDDLEKKLIKLNTETNTLLFREGDILDSIYMVESGQYAMFKLSSTGDQRVIFTLGPGEILNYPERRPYPISIACRVIRGGIVYKLEQKTLFEAIEKDPVLALNTIDLYNLRMRRLYRQLKNSSGSVRLDKRIAAKLWKLSKDYPTPHPEGVAIDLKITTTFLAELIGASRESVSRNLKPLLESGLVLQERGTFIIPDRSQLEFYFKKDD